MRKLLVSILLGSCLFGADVISVVPYTAYLDYGESSTKKNGSIYGVYANIGNLASLVEFDFATTDISYKDSNTSNLVQDEYTMIYHKYWYNRSIKLGLHANSTTDTSLQNGNTFIVGFNKWRYYSYDKLTYGADFYHTYYANGTDLDDNATQIRVNQFSPYFSYNLSAISFLNNFKFQINLGYIDKYSTKTYLSYEIKDTFIKGSNYYEISFLGGKMRNGIKGGGFTVYNSKDIITQSIGLKFGTYIKRNIKADFSYALNRFDEFGGNSGATNAVSVLTASFLF